jgi:hypothetical protein
MADLKEARVPDIGGDKVPVIEVLIKAGDRVEKEQSLITLESDKATMEVPAPFAGTVKEVKVKGGASGNTSITLRFDRQALVDAGVLTAGTTQLDVVGDLTTGMQIVSHVPVSTH